MKKTCGSMRFNSGVHTSPGTPEYGGGELLPKSWDSERIPVAGNGRIPMSPSALILPFNGGRTFPSKWDDAERWITSPVSGGKNHVSQSKSKSGPLGLPTPHVNSPAIPHHSSTAPATDASSSLHQADSAAATADNSIPPSFQEAKSKEEEVAIDPEGRRRDVGTQMSPPSSPKERLSFSALSLLSPVSIFPKKPPPPHPSSSSSSKDAAAIRDVQVDKDATATATVKATASSSPWAASRSTSKLRREEAKITAWENLQKARAEAEIRKLEMDLEKKRSASMDRISNKLRAAKKKAEEMRISLSNGQPQPSCCLNVKTRRRFLLCRREEVSDPCGM